MRDDKIGQQLSGFDLASVMRSADPQSEALSRFTGLSASTVRDALAVLVAVLIELGSGLGLWVATAGAGAGVTKARPPVGDTGKKERAASGLPCGSGELSAMACADGITPRKRGKPIDPVRAFLKSCCAERRGAEATAADLHRAFQAWAANQDQGPLSPKAFGTRLGELGFERVKRGGTVRYAGLCVR